MSVQAPDPAESVRLEQVESQVSEARFGRVYLVGTGPGDPELLTLKALRLMQEADLVLYDRLISPDILSLVSSTATMIYVGKQSGFHTRTQEEIHELLWQFASKGRTVLRLKGGDPTIFGRGGEEMDYLEAQGVPVEVVPGITAAVGVSAALGIPLTHRKYADRIQVITGHARGDQPLEMEYQSLVGSRNTLVVYMGLATLPELVEGLLTAGLPADTPAVAVQDGTTASQKIVTTTIGDLPAVVISSQLKSPTLVIIGHVVSLLDVPSVLQGEQADEQTIVSGARQRILEVVESLDQQASRSNSPILEP